MTYDPYDFDPEKSPWFLGATLFDGKVGDWMRANFALEGGQLPREMAELIRMLRDRDTAVAANSRGGAQEPAAPRAAGRFAGEPR